jgi:DNA-directed RNA polymerase subunit RPC12/RpoP
MKRALDMFGKPPVPRRVMMHVFDTSSNQCCGGDDPYMARYWCKKCGAITEWQSHRTITEARRGFPCQACNGEPICKP